MGEDREIRRLDAEDLKAYKEMLDRFREKYGYINEVESIDLATGEINGVYAEKQIDVIRSRMRKRGDEIRSEMESRRKAAEARIAENVKEAQRMRADALIKASTMQHSRHRGMGGSLTGDPTVDKLMFEERSGKDGRGKG